MSLSGLPATGEKNGNWRARLPGDAQVSVHLSASDSQLLSCTGGHLKMNLKRREIASYAVLTFE